nr:hypothetical protein [Tanacetum cinerariifolium]
MSLSLAENVIVAGADNGPPMLDKTNYRSWASRMLLYIKGKEYGKLLVDSVLNGPFQCRTIVEHRNETTPAKVRARTYTDLTDEEKIHESVDIKATNIVLQGSELSLQERESKLYDDFDTSTFMPGETIHPYYMWQHEAHGNEARLQRQRYSDPIALVANSPTCLNSTQYYPQLSSATQQYYSPHALQRSYDAPITVQGRQTQGYTNSGARNTATNQGVNRQEAPGQAMTVKCYNCQYEATFQTDDLDAFNSDCDDVPSAKAVLIANLSSYDSDLIALSVTDAEEILDLVEDSRLKMLAKQNDQILKEKKVNIAPVDYVALNKLSEHFVPQKQLSAEQAFWLPISQPVYEKPPVPSEPVFKKEIPRELSPLNLDMKAGFNQMETEVAKYYVDKKYFKIKKKELSLDHDLFLEHNICQDVMNTVMHANDHSDNVLVENNNSLEHDNSALEMLKHENDRLMELLVS